jgi:cytochrome c553
MNKLHFASTLMVLLLTPIAAIAVDGNTIINNGGANPVAVACVACHGEDLKGNASIPRTAGLPVDYLIKQLHDFRGGTRHNEMMGSVALALTEDEITAVAVALSAKPGVNVPETTPAYPTAGSAAWIVQRGAWERNIPACSSCHGPDGIGVGTVFPPLAGQQAQYIEAQLHAFKGVAQQASKRSRKQQLALVPTRYNDPNGLMRHIAAALTDTEINLLAEYFAALKVSDTPVAADRVFLK